MSRRKKEEIIVSSSQVSDIIAAEELLEKRISDAALEFGKYSACESITTLYTTEYLPEGKEGSLSERPSEGSYFKVYTSHSLTRNTQILTAQQKTDADSHLLYSRSVKQKTDPIRSR